MGRLTEMIVYPVILLGQQINQIQGFLAELLGILDDRLNQAAEIFLLETQSDARLIFR